MCIGKIHSIETLGTVDGPGIRNVIFLQGCNLKCVYCHNPDTWEFTTGKNVTADELLNEVLKYKSYMDFSKGGVTFSGGEPLLQAEFLNAAIKKMKERGIHIAIDTAASVKISNTIIEVIENTDLFIVDIKSINPSKFLQIAGKGINDTLDFIEELQKRQKKIWIRHVLVPGLTDSKKELEDLGEYISKLKFVEKVEILPFHKMGEEKWEKLCKEYILKNTEIPTQQMIDEAMRLIQNKSRD